MRNFLVFAFLYLAVLPNGQAKMSESADQRSIARLAQRYAEAFASNKVDEVLTCLTDDFVAITPDKPPVVGRSAVGAAIAGDFAHMEILQLKFQPDEIFAEGSWGFARGISSGTIKTKPDGQQVELKGKFLWVVHKVNGTWLVARDSAFGDEPAK